MQQLTPPVEQPVYPSWVRSRPTRTFWLLGAGILLLAGVAGWFWRPGYLLALLALPPLYIAAILSLARWRLSPAGDDLQRRIHRMIADAVGHGASLLDIGCGSGQLIIGIAKTEPGRYVGIDYWGENWEYSRAQAMQNAALEGVPTIDFQRASASRLPFADGDFARVTSCMTFHEVQDVADKTVSVAEALRVLAVGGRFAFVDLFDDHKRYRGRESVLQVIRAGGGTVERAEALSDLLALRFPMQMGQVLKYAVLVSGVKSTPTAMAAEVATEVKTVVEGAEDARSLA